MDHYPWLFQFQPARVLRLESNSARIECMYFPFRNEVFVSLTRIRNFLSREIGWSRIIERKGRFLLLHIDSGLAVPGKNGCWLQIRISSSSNSSNGYCDRMNQFRNSDHEHLSEFYHLLKTQWWQKKHRFIIKAGIIKFSALGNLQSWCSKASVWTLYTSLIWRNSLTTTSNPWLMISN